MRCYAGHNDFFHQTAVRILLNLSNRSEKMHLKKNVLVKQWSRAAEKVALVVQS